MTRASLPPGVSRVDEPDYRKHGYLVRLRWVKGRPTIRRFFGDHSHEGKRQALVAASRWAEARR